MFNKKERKIPHLICTCDHRGAELGRITQHLAEAPCPPQTRGTAPSTVLRQERLGSFGEGQKKTAVCCIFSSFNAISMRKCPRVEEVTLNHWTTSELPAVQRWWHSLGAQLLHWSTHFCFCFEQKKKADISYPNSRSFLNSAGRFPHPTPALWCPLMEHAVLDAFISRTNLHRT